MLASRSRALLRVGAWRIATRHVSGVPDPAPSAAPTSATDAAPARTTAVHISRVPRLKPGLLPRAYNAAPLPVAFSIKRAGGDKKRYKYLFHDERSLAKEASVVTGTLTHKAPPDADLVASMKLRESRRRTNLQPRTIMQVSNVMSVALGSGQPGAKQAARAIALAAVETHAEAERGEEVGSYGWLRRVTREAAAYQIPPPSWPPGSPRRRRQLTLPAKVVGGQRKGGPECVEEPELTPYTTQRGLTSDVHPLADVLRRQPAADQTAAARAGAAEVAAAGAASAAADVGNPPPMAAGRVFGTRGAAWGAVHPDAEQLAARVRSRELALRGWLDSLPAAQQAREMHVLDAGEDSGSDDSDDDEYE